MKNSKFILDIDVDEIKILDYGIIEETFLITEKELKKGLRTPNNSENYWYPSAESGFSEQDVYKICALFRKKFPDIQILDKHGYERTEIFLNTLEKHVFAYSVIHHLKQINENGC